MIRISAHHTRRRVPIRDARLLQADAGIPVPPVGGEVGDEHYFDLIL